MKRFIFPLALLALTAAANASVTYHFFDIGQDFTLTVPNFITSTQSFTSAQFDSQNPGIVVSTDAATFTPGAVADTLETEYTFNNNSGNVLDFDFDPGAFGAFGTYAATNRSATLEVTQAVPEPASLAALSLGAVSLLRRRKRA